MNSLTHIITDRLPTPRVAARVRETVRGWCSDPALRQGAWSVIDQGIVSGTSFVTSVTVGRCCGRTELGIYFLALSIVSFVRAVQGELIGAPYVVYCHRRRGAALASYSGSALLHQSILSAVSVLAMSCLIGVLACGIGPTALTPTLVVMLGAMPLVLLREMLRDLAFGQLQIMRAVAIDAAVAALQLGALGLLAQTGLLTVELVYAVMGGACATACLGWFLAKRQPLAVERRRVLADWRENWSFAKWALAGQLLGRATSYLLPWLVALAHGEVATGLLAACITLVNLAGTFIAGVSRFLTPKAAQAFADEGARALNRVLGKAALIFLATLSVFCAAMLFAGDRVVVVVYGPSYAGAGTVMSILALAMLADSLGITAGNGLWAIDQPQANFVADAATFVVTIALVICLVGPVGVAGAAWAMLGGALAGVGIRAGTYWKLCPQADLSSG